MQNHDWNDLKYLLALFRTGRLRKAADLVNVSETTVARRVGTLEATLGVSLFVRAANGRYEATDAALRMLSHAEAVENENREIRKLSGDIANRIAGNVRVSAVPIVVNRILVPNLSSLVDRFPHLTVELIPASQNLDLSRREADLAVRLARPATGGLRTKAQKLGDLAFAAFAARSSPPETRDRLGWISYDEAHAGLPQARWLDRAMRRSAEGSAGLRVADAETALEAVASGLGKSLLPLAAAKHDPRLEAIASDRYPDPPRREVWMLAHVDQAARASIAAVKDWLTGLRWS